MTGIAYAPGEEWAIVAKRDGRHDLWKLMMHTFGTCSSKEQILARVRMRLIGDEVFRRKYRGWRFLPVEYTEAIFVTEAGAVQMHKDEVEGFAVGEWK